MQPSRSEFITVDGLRMHVRRWGRPGAPKIFMVHGWMDSSATFQFVVDAFKQEWDIIAPDWRGYGLSEWQNRTYWFHDYLADLGPLLDHYSSGQPVQLVGHSMGASAASMFAGLHPDRVEKLVSLDGYGVPPQAPGMSLQRLSDWMAARNRGAPRNREYADFADFAGRLMQANPRLTSERADFLARNFGQLNEADKVVVAADPYHRLPMPMVMHIEDYHLAWSRITAPVLWVVGDDSYLYKRFENREADYQACVASFKSVHEVVLKDVGHNVHHDVPQRIAALIEEFLAQ